MSNHVLIVAAGEWGDRKRDMGDYRAEEEMLVRLLERQERGSFFGDYRSVKVEVVSDVLQARKKLQHDSVLVFTTRGMIKTAQAIKAEDRRRKVVVLAGAIGEVPDGPHVLILDKSMMDCPEALARAILDW